MTQAEQEYEAWRRYAWERIDLAIRKKRVKDQYAKELDVIRRRHGLVLVEGGRDAD
jgi:hypothetical protein